METFFSSILAGFSPTISEKIVEAAVEAGKVSPGIMVNYGSMAIVIFLIALFFNMIRAYRNCWKESYGIEYGIMRGMILSTVCVLAYAGVGMFMGVAATQPFIGIILAITYLITYLFTYPAYGAC